ncbi:MAG: hypothetical protein JXC32_17170, partial [Anaerolineae bacterium]|nr:hypothetical protein [Anaerolineae bacterium]
MTWLLKDLEDNLFVTREWGRPVDLERYWFSHGGVTIQPNLMDLALDYLRRGQVKHALRALFNNFGASLYPDVRTFTEHPVTELGHGVGPFYKSSDESKALIWLRHCLLHEEGDTLHLALGAPQAWFATGQPFGVHNMATSFGPISYQIARSAQHTLITFQRSADHPRASRLQAIAVHVRHPGDAVATSIHVDGVPLPALPVDNTVVVSSPPLSCQIDVVY